MEISAIADTVAVATARGLGFAKYLISRRFSLPQSRLSVAYETSAPVEVVSTGGIFAIWSGILPVDAASPPIVKSSSLRAPPRLLIRRARRTRRKSLAGEEDDGGEFGSGDGDDGPFGGGGGWNFGSDGGANWGEEASWRDPAFDFVYEVLGWIVLSNCLHFAFKKMARHWADGIGDPSREKVPVPLVY